MKPIHVWWDEPGDGPTNMAADEVLAAEALRRDALLVRIYGWIPTTISLGAFQKIDAATGSAAIRGVPLVRRPSGGGAIVHGSDLTYAAAVPKSHWLGAAPQLLYDALHSAMARALADWGITAALWQPVTEQPASGGHADDDSFFCFDRRASGDLVVQSAATSSQGRGHKIMGSAQRRLEAAVLQHGSLLIRSNSQVSGPARHPGVTDLLAGVPASPPDVQVLVRRWLALVAGSLGADLVEETVDFRGLAAAAISETAARFREARWLGRR